MKKFSKYLYNLLLVISAIFLVCFGKSNFSNTANASTSYIISFYASGGEVNNNNVCFINTNSDGRLIDSEGELLTELPTPTIEDKTFIFGGWFMGDVVLTPVTVDTVFTSNVQVNTLWLTKSFNYTVSSYTSENSTLFDIIGETTNSTSYTLATSVTSLANVLNIVYDDLISTAVPTINFNNVELSENEPTISLQKNITLTGSISSSSSFPVFNLAPNTSNLTTYQFKDIVIENNVSNVIVSTTSTEHTPYITLENASFIGNNNNSYAIYFSEENNINLIGNNSHTTSFLFNYNEQLTITVNSALTNPNSNPIIIETYSKYDGIRSIENFNPLNANLILFKNNSIAYTVENTLVTTNNTALVTNAIINFEFDLNGGEYSSNYLKQNYYHSQSKTFPIADDLQKTYFIFDAWFGKITFSNTQKNTWGLEYNTYYYDSIILKQFKESGYNVDLIDTIFKTNITDFNTNNAFYQYAYDPTTSNEKTYLVFDLAESLQTIPELIARWSPIQYTITFNTDGGNPQQSLSAGFGDEITAPTPTKTGYTFVGWFTSLASSIPYTFTTMPAYNFTLIAKWQIASFTVTFKSEGNTFAEITQNYNTTIEKPTITKTGHIITNWLIDGTNTAFDFITPGQDTIVNVIWDRETYYVLFNANPENKPEIDAPLTMFSYKYGDLVELPSNPTTEGHEFLNWFKDSTYQYIQSFPFAIEQSITLFANWKVNQYKISFISNGGSLVSEENYYYATKVSPPNPPTKQGYIFDGWFTDSELQNAFIFNENTTMGANNITLYAKWIPKNNILLDLTKQITSVDKPLNFKIESVLNGFVIEYKINDVWVRTTPTEIGVYDVRISRAEDANYNNYVYELDDGYEIINKTLNLDWIIALLFIILVLEIIAIIVIKHLQKTKKVPITTFSIALPFGIITTKQAVLVGVAGVLVIATFIYMIYELIKLNKISIEESSEPSIYNARHTLEKMGDHSEDVKIANKVDDILNQEGFITFEITDKDNINKDNSDKIDE